MYTSDDERLGYYIRQYGNERNGKHYYVTDEGFIAYRLNGDEIIIDEYFLNYPYRKGLRAFSFVNEFISALQRRNNNTFKTLIGFVDTDTTDGYSISKLFELYNMKQDLGFEQPGYLKYVKELHEKRI